MFRAASMSKVRAFVLERDVQRVTEMLGRLGLVHLRKSIEEGGGQLQPEQLREERERCTALEGRLARLMALLEVEAPGAILLDQRAPGSLDGTEALVRTVEKETAEPRDELEQAEQALGDNDVILKALAPYRSVRAPLGQLAGSRLLDVRAGLARADRLADLRAAMPDGVLLVPLSEPEPGEHGGLVEALAISSRRRRFAMETVLDQHGFVQRELPLWGEKGPAALYAEAAAKDVALKGRSGALRERLREIGRRHAAEMRSATGGLAIQRRLYEAEQNFGTTWATAVISGWVPAARTEQVRRAVEEATGGRCVFETAPPDAQDVQDGLVPTLVLHSRWLAPFRILVTSYGTALYTEIEPTVMFAVSFLLMFGIMFGDLGHGLLLLVGGILVRRLARNPDLRDLGFVVAAAGGVSTLCGTFFQGSFLGKSLKDMGFPLTLGFEPIRFQGSGAEAQAHVVRYLLLALFLGVALISLGGVLNIINRLRRRDLEGGLLDRFGLAGMVFYWSLLALVAKLALAGRGPADGWLIGLAGAALVALALRAPGRWLLGRAEKGAAGGLAMAVFEGLIEGLETVMVFLANTFSFLRVAAFALSHAALCFTVFVVIGMVGGLPGGPIWSVLVFIVGTALIIGLEGMIVFIQILRLEYYEFFTKFFRGEGLRYEPFRLS